ncbi:MAG: hypothetical protein AVDCRST_MAG08-1134, partial [uncultured Acetobacteraceae bacterium]
EPLRPYRLRPGCPLRRADVARAVAADLSRAHCHHARGQLRPAPLPAPAGVTV